MDIKQQRMLRKKEKALKTQLVVQSLPKRILRSQDARHNMTENKDNNNHQLINENYITKNEKDVFRMSHNQNIPFLVEDFSSQNGTWMNDRNLLEMNAQNILSLQNNEENTLFTPNIIYNNLDEEAILGGKDELQNQNYSELPDFEIDEFNSLQPKIQCDEKSTNSYCSKLHQSLIYFNQSQLDDPAAAVMNEEQINNSLIVNQSQYIPSQYTYGVQKEDDHLEFKHISIPSDETIALHQQQQPTPQFDEDQIILIKSQRNTNQGSIQLQKEPLIDQENNNFIQDEKQQQDIFQINTNVIKNIMTSFKRFILLLFRTSIQNNRSYLPQKKNHVSQMNVIRVYFDNYKNNENDLQLEDIRDKIIELYNKQTKGRQSDDRRMFLKKFLKAFKNKKFNSHSLQQLQYFSPYSVIFIYFLQNFAINWLSNSRISNYNSHINLIQKTLITQAHITNNTPN